MMVMSLKYHDSEVFLQSEVGIPLWEKMEILAVFQFLNGCFMWQQEVKYVFSIQWYKSVLLSITTTHILITYIYRRWTAKAAANFHMDHNWWFLWLDVPLHYLQFIVAGLKSGLWYTDVQPSVVLLFWLLLIYMATSPLLSSKGSHIYSDYSILSSIKLVWVDMPKFSLISYGLLAKSGSLKSYHQL
jgi:hypothetical protein